MSNRARCPTCRVPMREVSHRNVHIDICDCSGMWFDPGEVERWADRDRQLRSFPQFGEHAVADTRTGPCPRCAGEELRLHVFDGLRYARCERCAGVWLDADAVAQLDPSPGSEHLPGAYYPPVTIIDALLNLFS